MRVKTSEYISHKNSNKKTQTTNEDTIDAKLIKITVEVHLKGGQVQKKTYELDTKIIYGNSIDKDVFKELLPAGSCITTNTRLMICGNIEKEY